MDPARLNRNTVDRSSVWVAIVAAIIGLYMLVQGVLFHLEEPGSVTWIFVVIGLIFIALAVPVYRGSDEAAVAVAWAFLMLMLFVLLAGGFRALLPWPAIMAVILVVAMRGGLKRRESWPRRTGRRRSSTPASSIEP